MHLTATAAARTTGFLTTLVLGALFAGCASVYAPSIRPADGESPAVVAKDAESYSLAMGSLDWDRTDGTYGQHFVQLGLTRGMGGGTDLRAVATASLPADPGDTAANSEIALALRGKWSPPPVSRFFAVTAGGGMGYGWLHATYSFELGVIVGYENPYVVPYFDQRGSFNGNLTTRTEREAARTFSSQSIVGARIALRPRRARGPWLRAEAGRSNYRSGDAGFDNLFYRAQFDMPIRDLAP